MLHLNIRSINTYFDEFLVLLEGLKIKFDMIVLTETWSVSNKNEFLINGYNIKYSESALNSGDGIIFIYLL